MILPLLLFAAAAPQRDAAANATIEVPAGRWAWIDVPVRSTPAHVDCRYSVESGGSGVRVTLLARSDLDRFRAGEAHRVIAGAPYARTGAIRHAVPEGDYAIVVDNRLEGRTPARVHLVVTVVYPRVQHVEVRVPSGGRKAAAIGLSALFLAGVWLFAGRRVLRAYRERPPEPPPPSFWI